MSGVSHDEEAEVHVGVVVRPLRGHWRPVKLSGQPRFDFTNSKGSSTLDPSVWKTTRNANNEASIEFTSKMVYSNRNIKEIDSSFDKRNRSTHPEEAVRYRRGETQINSDALVEPCHSTCTCNDVSSVCPVALDYFEHRRLSRFQGIKSESPPLKCINQTPGLANMGKAERAEAQITSKPSSEIANHKFETIASGLLSNYSNRPNNAPKGNAFQPRIGDVKMKLYQDASKAPLKSEPFSTSDLSSPLTDERGVQTVSKVRKPSNPFHAEKDKLKRTNLSMTKSRLKTVTYREEDVHSTRLNDCLSALHVRIQELASFVRIPLRGLDLSINTFFVVVNI
uniref:Uncharacterized protein n=1 Tax=Angiostrongylus cantonensis TaxID=6313 RepID=A0A0K0CY88_ANGCA